MCLLVVNSLMPVFYSFLLCLVKDGVNSCVHISLFIYIHVLSYKCVFSKICVSRTFVDSI